MQKAVFQILIIALLFMCTSCELIGDVFRLGVNVGIFMVIFVLVIIGYVAFRIAKR